MCDCLSDNNITSLDNKFCKCKIYIKIRIYSNAKIRISLEFLREKMKTVNILFTVSICKNS